MPVLQSIIHRCGIGVLAYFSICVTRWFLRAVDKAASRAARLTVHLHIPFLQQLYRAATVRFRGMKSPLNVVRRERRFLPEFNIVSAREKESARRDIRKGRAMIRSEKRALHRARGAAEHVESRRKVTSNIFAGRTRLRLRAIHV